MLFQPPDSSPPVIVKLIKPEEHSEFQQLADVLFGALGLTGVLVLGALLLGVLGAAVIFWIRSRRDDQGSDDPPHIHRGTA